MECVDRSFFSITLGIKEPWIIEKIEMDEKENLHIYVSFKKGGIFECPVCHKKYKAYDTTNKTWRHLNFFQYPTYIHCKVPRIQCDEDKTKMVEVPWANKNSGFTILFEEYVMRLAKKMPIHAVGKIVKEYDGKLWRIVHRYAKNYVESLDFTETKRIGLDETSRRGHEYIMVFIDLDTSRIMYIIEGKKASNIEEFKEFFLEHKGKPEQIEYVTMDMTMGYKNKIKKSFENAKIIYDKFHVIRAVNEAVDKVRKKEVCENPELKKTRYIWLKNRKNLNKYQEEKMLKMSKMNLKTGKAYRLKIAFQDIYNMPYDREMAEMEFKEWMSWAVRSKLPEFRDIARTIGNKLDGILNYFKEKLTNAVLEGVNSLIQSVKSKARGFKRIENFKAMIYLMNSENQIVG